MLPEVETLLERITDRRDGVVKAIEGLDADALDYKPLPADMNSLIVLAVHSLGSERHWLHEVVGQKKVERNRESEFRARAEAVTSLTAMFAAAAMETKHIFSLLTEEDMNASRPLDKSRSCTVRWAILHSLEHYSEHLAQMWLTRQLWENKNARPHEI